MFSQLISGGDLRNLSEAIAGEQAYFAAASPTSRRVVFVVLSNSQSELRASYISEESPPYLILVGWMFWFTLKKLVGSYFALIVAKRS